MVKGFNTGEPLAYFLTWTTYGTWLPGDERGWNRKGDQESLVTNRARQESAMAKLKERSFVLSSDDCSLVETVILQHCEMRAWKSHALSIRSNHVHTVVSAANCQPETVVSQFKAWCSRRLKERHPERKRFWTQGVSTRWINQESDLAAAIEYTLDAQDRKSVEYDRSANSRN